MRKLIILFTAVEMIFYSFVCTGCQNEIVRESSFKRSGVSTETAGTKRNVSLVCWNLQTFFDAVTVGTEYKEFKNAERWTKEKYHKRLDKLCDVMTSLYPDIFVMEEVENEDVVQDIANALSGGSWNSKKMWQYACFAKETGSSIGCAVFSRYELDNLKTHSLDIRTQLEEQPSARPLMQMTVFVGEQELELFVNHWKSKSGGEEETEIWRDWQELVLAENVKDADGAVLMCGDFNRSAEDFILQSSDSDGSNTLLRSQNGVVKAYSPWFRSDGKFATENGSYFYNGSWERIDNILIKGNLSMNSFCTVTESPVADEEGIPVAYKIFTGEGCSDHLPLKCVISILL